MVRGWIVGVLAAGVIVGPGGDGAAAAESVQKVTVTADEFSFRPKEITVRPGRVEFTIRNVGSYAHSVAIVLPGRRRRAPPS